MKLVIGIAIWISALAVPAHADTPTIDRAIADAASAGKPLFVELSATWCGPCKTFAQTTLIDQRVRAALGGVYFVRYDADEATGEEVQDRYNVDAFPTFLAIDRTGVVRARFVGAYLGEEGVLSYIADVSKVAAAVRDEASVRSELKARPRDVAVALSAARWFEGHDLREEALGTFEAASRVAGALPAQRAEAGRSATRLRRLLKWREQLVTEKLEQLRRDPASATTDDIAIAVLGVKRPLTAVRPLLGLLINAHTDPMPLTQTILAALAVGATDEALTGANKLIAQRRDVRSLRELAEVRHARGERTEALRVIDEAIRLNTNAAYTDQLADNRARYTSTSNESPMVAQLRTSTEYVWTRLEQLDSLAIPAGVGRAAGFDRSPEVEQWRKTATALRRLQTKLAVQCRPKSGGSSEAFGRIVVDALGTVKTSVWHMERAAPASIETCLSGAVQNVTLPTDGAGQEYVLHVQLRTP